MYIHLSNRDTAVAIEDLSIIHESLYSVISDLAADDSPDKARQPGCHGCITFSHEANGPDPIGVAVDRCPDMLD